ncbi:MAG: DUF935 family protein [Candidatus Riflebacteria bacterium]|nr:DUF935 family protein [Candidatus Riflebacteria bacterium]
MIVKDKRSSSGEKAKLPAQYDQEIASIQKDITRTFGGNFLKNQDPTLVSRGQGKGLLIYDEIQKDCHAYAVLQKRKLAVVSRPWQVDAGGENPADVEAAAEVRRQLDNLNFDFASYCLLGSVLKGFAVAEIIWEVVENKIIASKIKPKNQRRFVFDLDGKLKLLTPNNQMDGEELPDNKFIVHRNGSEEDDLYGLGLGSKLYWPTLFKHEGITFWLAFTEKFGSPTAIGKYDASASLAQQNKLMAALRGIQQDAGIIIPKDMEISLLEGQKYGSINTYEDLCRYMDELISEAVLGETGSTNQSGGSGSRARDQVGNEVRLEIAVADSDLLSQTYNSTLVKWITDYNFPGAAYPKVWRNFKESEDSNTLATRDKSLTETGVKFTKKYYTKQYNLEDDDFEIVVTPSKSSVPSSLDNQNVAQFGEPVTVPGDEKNALDIETILEKNSDRLASEWQKLLGDRVSELLAMLEETKDFDTFEKNMTELLVGPPPKELSESLNRAMLVSNLLGRLKIQQSRQEG